ncbi:D-alanyl-D-alanine carboxypeptidase [Lachnospiraceae bacterium MD1]|jgi:D-alanyl-D-alanine carboxypeptidase (penicillin-binding protein 5/6)|uniref:serine-type D-Ala-D-Ala carboxypeptidase n=1 Tax=Variimorphobacter saccharofermentans TaxID=2755051 RepID=A0A839K098_9FIRM|nr:D-alanyl-D-alanine carboxypeptidase family protein [Variimorphobacter saccharofermentans]MBB2183056.1 D-alanyl-D-alanine carboxypeptidase [Variimorphobacter saccharofermentans]
MKRIVAVFLICSVVLILLFPNTLYAKVNNTKPDKEGDAVMVTAPADARLELSTPSAVLIEGSTGTVIFEKNKDERLKPASITKIMTLLLIFEALDANQIKLTDEVSVSEHAASMGGSQVYLEPFEVQTVETMIKCISIASANDASVAMAEFIAGSEEEFVARMNAKAKELGMNNTNFVNCCGLDTDNHYSSAYDVALMSRELITKHPEISNYATIWMDTIIHTTKKGQSEFGLTNTNKLVKFYQGITGLKTGSTSLAKFCVSASARRNNMDLIAVIMAAPDTKTRFMEASKLLNYGFANYSIYTDDNSDITLEPVRVVKGVTEKVEGKTGSNFSYLCVKGKTPEKIRKEVVLMDAVEAPVQIGDKIGEITYYYENEKIGSIEILSTEKIEKAGFKDYFLQLLVKYFMGKPQP